MSYDAPFAGLKVIDLSQGIAGPYCAMLLAQHGAEVIKVEGIGEGDWARTLGTRYGSHSAYSIIGNLGKASAIAWSMFLILLIVAAINLLFTRRLRKSQ